MKSATATTSSYPQNRISVFDNLRFLFVFGVVIQHASMAYFSDWWPVIDDPSLLVGAITGLFDGFLMPSLFFISGYFAIPSMQKKSMSQFIAGKLRRLGIPWLVCTLFIGPVLPLVYHFTRNGLSLPFSYAAIWLAVMKNALSLNFGILPPMTTVMQHDLFYQRYMWFISLLMVFFLIFALVYTFKKDWFQARKKTIGPGQSSPRSPVKTIISIGMLTFLGSIVLIGTMFAFTDGVSNPESWFTLGNVIQFRVSRIFLHITYFTLGILSYKSNWINQGRFSGNTKNWMLSFAVVLGAYYCTYYLMMSTADSTLEKCYGLLMWLCLNFYTITALGLSISIGLKYGQRQTPLTRTLAANSYNLYLSHYLLVIGFQLVLYMLPGIPALLKFILVSILSIICGCLVSRYLIKPYPKITIAMVTSVFILMVLVIHP